jgi:hypothetical protein
MFSDGPRRPPTTVQNIDRDAKRVRGTLWPWRGALWASVAVLVLAWLLLGGLAWKVVQMFGLVGPARVTLPAGCDESDQATAALIRDAVLAFEAKHGRPPSTLAEIVPDHMAALPTPACPGWSWSYRTWELGERAYFDVGRVSDDDGAASFWSSRDRRWHSRAPYDAW